jgi:hypothetical protein
LVAGDRLKLQIRRSILNRDTALNGLEQWNLHIQTGEHYTPVFTEHGNHCHCALGYGAQGRKDKKNEYKKKNVTAKHDVPPNGESVNNEVLNKLGKPRAKANDNCYAAERGLQLLHHRACSARCISSQ